MTVFARSVIGALLLALAAVTVAQAQPPKRVLILHSWGPEFGDLYAKDLRTQLSRQLPGTCELYEEWLVSARFAESQNEEAFARYLDTLFDAHPLDIVITLGAPAANFLQTHRDSVFQDVPKLFADVEERRASRSTLAPNEAAVPITVSFPALVRNILAVRPKTRTLAVVIGNSPIEKFWVSQIRDSLEPFRSRITFTFLTDLPFKDVLRRVATLPAQSAILYVLLSPHIDGIPLDEDTALAQLHDAANAPMFSYTDAYLGKGIVGGPLISGEEQGRETVRAAARLLSGEPAAGIRIAPISLGKPVFDWRELKRWGISESDLPPSSTILFRVPSAWERYRWQIAAVGSVLIVMAALIISLLYEHRRWLVAERSARQGMAELSRINRRATVGELSASITHELAQPLSAIGNNASVVALLLGEASPDLVELREINFDIVRDQRRAVEVIKRLRGLFTKSTSDAQVIDLSDVVQEVFGLLSAHAFAHRVTLKTQLSALPVLVIGDRVQLQQVILNLVTNGVDAIESAARSEREITGRTFSDGVSAEVSIEDTGPGLPGDSVEQIFEPFFTTKDAGMGMGLAIARSIIVIHGGRIWAEDRPGGGAAFRFAMPLAKSQRSIA